MYFCLQDSLPNLCWRWDSV